MFRHKTARLEIATKWVYFDRLDSERQIFDSVKSYFVHVPLCFEKVVD